MSALAFHVVEITPQAHAAVPSLKLRLRIDAASGEVIHAIALSCQIRIEANRRDYSREEGERLLELFGERPRWGETLRPFFWMHVTTMVNGFEEATEIELPLVCSYDLEVAAAKYLHALGDGEIPLLLLFSGTVFAKTDGSLQVRRIPWECEARHRLPARVWRATMDRYYPNSGWLRLDRETLDALGAFKARHALPTWEGAIRTLLRDRDGART